MSTCFWKTCGIFFNYFFCTIFRLALLDDIHKQIKANNVSAFLSGAQGPPFRRIDAALAGNGNTENEEEVGVASGYAIQHSIPSGFVTPQNHANDIDNENYQRYSVAGNKAGMYIYALAFDTLIV